MLLDYESDNFAITIDKVNIIILHFTIYSNKLAFPLSYMPLIPRIKIELVSIKFRALLNKLRVCYMIQNCSKAIE